jgi:hypothetical protein
MDMTKGSVGSMFARYIMAGAVCIAFSLLLTSGCNKQANVPSVPALPPNDTAEGKLARVMQRLDSAIETAQAASGSGVISQRRASHKMLPPSNGSDLPEAVIYIETTRALAPQAINSAAKAKLEAAKAEAEKQGEEIPEVDGRPLVVDDERQVEVDEFQLAYDGQRWKLVTELKPTTEEGAPSTEYILFDYALDAN